MVTAYWICIGGWGLAVVVVGIDIWADVLAYLDDASRRWWFCVPTALCHLFGLGLSGVWLITLTVEYFRQRGY